MPIKWRLTITQKIKYTDNLILYHDSLERIQELVNFLEAMFGTDNIQYKIESVPEDEEYGMDE